MTRARVDQYENKENKGSKSDQPCNLCRGALNRALAITRNIMLLIDWSIVINYALRKTRGVSRSIYQGLYLEEYQEKYNIFPSSFFLTHVHVHVQTEYICNAYPFPVSISWFVHSRQPATYYISREWQLERSHSRAAIFREQRRYLCRFLFLSFSFFFFISISSPALIRSHCARFCPRPCRSLSARPRRLNRLYRGGGRQQIIQKEILFSLPRYYIFVLSVSGMWTPLWATQTFSKAAPVSCIKA